MSTRQAAVSAMEKKDEREKMELPESEEKFSRKAREFQRRDMLPVNRLWGSLRGYIIYAVWKVRTCTLEKLKLSDETWKTRIFTASEALKPLLDGAGVTIDNVPPSNHR